MCCTAKGVLQTPQEARGWSAYVRPDSAINKLMHASRHDRPHPPFLLATLANIISDDPTSTTRKHTRAFLQQFHHFYLLPAATHIKKRGFVRALVKVVLVIVLEDSALDAGRAAEAPLSSRWWAICLGNNVHISALPSR